MSAPLSPLELAAAHLLALADGHDQAAQAVWGAQLQAVKVHERVEKTHGTVCDDTAKALKRAEDERRRACLMVQSQSEDLAVKLKHAAEKYGAIDAEEKRRIAQQLRPGS